MTGTLSKSELRDCIFWLAKLEQDIRYFGTDAQSLPGELAELRDSCIDILAEINHPDSYIHGLRCRDRQAICRVLKQLGASMQNLHQAVSCRENLDKDILLRAMQPWQLANHVQAFDTQLTMWLGSARSDEYLGMRDTFSYIFSILKDIKSLTDTTLEVADLVSGTGTRSPTLIASPRHTPEDSDIEATNTTDVLKDVTNVGIFVKERLLLPTASKSLAAFGRSFSIYSVAEHAVLTHEIGPSFVADHTHRLTTLG